MSTFLDIKREEVRRHDAAMDAINNSAWLFSLLNAVVDQWTGHKLRDRSGHCGSYPSVFRSDEHSMTIYARLRMSPLDECADAFVCVEQIEDAVGADAKVRQDGRDIDCEWLIRYQRTAVVLRVSIERHEEGCRHVQVGERVTPVYEWRCK
jgi:hypothetical protein